MSSDPWYNPSKDRAARRALGWGLVALAFPFACNAVGINDWGCYVGGALLIAALYGFAWFMKHNRDERGAAQAALERVEQDMPTSPYGQPAPKTTPGSGYIGLDFGPKPLPPESL